MKILVIIYEFPPVGGGGGHAAREICQELVRKGHEVRVLTAHYKDLPRQEVQENVHITRVPSLRKSPFQAGLLPMAGYILAAFWVGLNIIRHWKPDILHAHFAVPSGPVAWALALLHHVPYVLTAHLGDVPGGVPEKTDRWFRWIQPFTPPIWQNADRIVAVSQHTCRLVQQVYPVNPLVIPNGVDLQRLSPAEITLGAPPVIAFAGRFVTQKNPLLLVRTLGQLQEYPWKCVMMGDGSLLSAVKAEIQRLGLESRFNLPGWVTPEEVTDALGQADILFMPSYWEGLPVVGVKALAKGLAFVVSDIGGFLDLVDTDQNGYLYHPDDQEGFRHALANLLGSPERLHSFRQASLLKAKEFDIRLVAAEYEKLFTEICK